MEWDGKERRKNFRCPEHQQLFADVAVIKSNVINLNKNLDGTITDICKHIEESKPYRDKIIRHDEAIDSFKGVKALVVTTLITVVFAIIGFAIVWGALQNQVKVNTEDIKNLRSGYHIE